jgi:hypothetical protein
MAYRVKIFMMTLGKKAKKVIEEQPPASNLLVMVRRFLQLPLF